MKSKVSPPKKSKEQLHIESILKEYTPSGFSRLSANVLERDISTGFTGGNKFVYELLQNADDSSENGKQVHVQFQLIKLNQEQFFLFSHNGNHFSRKNVKKITRYADQDDAEESDEEDSSGQTSTNEVSKSKDQSKIGYKGVGFKAVFTISDCAIIFSGNYRFRFDANSRKETGWPNNKPYPWQVMPIWTELKDPTVPTELQKYISNDDVNFLIKIKPEVNIKKSFDFIKDNTRMLLFLKNVSKVTLNYHDFSESDETHGEPEEIILTKDPVGMYEITHNFDPSKNTRWLIRSRALKIESSLKDELQSMSAQACPDRLKNAEEIELTFAARVVNGKLTGLRNTRLFCYLPTQVMPGLPFLVNADFLLDPSRAIIIDNKWNAFLFKSIAREHFNWLSELSQTQEFRIEVLNILAPSEIRISSETCAKEFKKGYETASQTIPFVPGKPPKSALLLSQAVVDWTGFYVEFQDLNPTISGKELIEPKLSSLEKIKVFKPSAIDFNNLPSYLSQHCQEAKTIEDHVRIISYVHTHQKMFDQERLKKTDFILDHSNNASAPGSLFFERVEGTEQYPDIDQLRFIHPNLLPKLNRKWLASLDVQIATPIKLFRTHVLSLISENKLTEKNIVLFTRFIFSLFCQGLLNDADIARLKSLKVLIKNNKLAEAKRCYLSDCYFPDLKLEESVANPSIFVSEHYLDGNNKLSERWGEFFSEIGVNRDVVFRSENLTVLQGKERVWKFDSYFVHLQTNDQATAQVHGNQYIQNLVYSPMMSLIECPDVIPSFFKRLTSQWPIINNGRPMYYQMSKTSRPITTTYLQFIFTTHRCFLGDDFQYRPANQLFSGQFQSLQPFDKQLVLVNPELDLNDDVLRYCGVNYQLSFEQCLTLLVKIDMCNEIDYSCIGTIWKQLLIRVHSLTSYELIQLSTLKIRFPTQTNELKLKSEIQCFAVKDHATPFGSCWLKHYPDFSDEEMQAIAGIFNISIFSQNPRLSFDSNVLVRDLETPDAFFAPISVSSQWSMMGILVYLEGRQRGLNNWGILWLEIAKRFVELEFYKADGITCHYGDKKEAKVSAKIYLDQHRFYYKGTWKTEKRISRFATVLGIFLGFSKATIEQSQSLLMTPLNKLTTKIRKMMLKDEPPFEQHKPIICEDAPKVPAHLAVQPDNIDAVIEEKGSTSHSDKSEENSGDQDPSNPDSPPSAPHLKVTPKGTPPLSRQHKEKMSKTQSPTDEPLSSKLVNPARFDFSKLRKIPDAVFSVKKKTTKPSPVNLTLLRNAPLPKATPNSNNHSTDEEVAELPKYQAPPSTSKKPELTTQDKNLIGRCGEEFIYQYLREKYVYKYKVKEDEIVDGDNGFEITAIREGKTIIITVIWHNLDRKRDEDRDITIIKPPNKHDGLNNPNQFVHRYIEVKSTTTSKQTFNWTAREVALAKAEGNCYKLIHIKNIDTDDPTVRKIRDPINKLDEELVIEGYKIGF